MDCPACKRALIVVERAGIEIDWCPACKGIWFDAGELELLAESAGHEFVMPPPDAPPAGRRCPRCPAKMGVRTVPGDPPLEVDLCPRGHGIWLDHGELGALIRALPESRATSQAQVVVEFLGEVFRSGTTEPRPGTKD